MTDRAGNGNGSRDTRGKAKEPTEVARRYILSSQDVEEHVHPPTEETLRATEVDLRKAKQAERVVAGLFMLAGAAAIGFMVVYVIFSVGSVNDLLWSNRLLGITMTITFTALAVATTYWIRRLMPQEEVTQERPPLPSTREKRRAFDEYFEAGADASGITRRPLLRRTLLLALVPIGVAPLFLLRGLGKDMKLDKLKHSVWAKGRRLIAAGTGEAIRPEDFAAPGSLLTVVPEGFEHDQQVLAHDTVQLIKFRPSELEPPTRIDWGVDGIIAYSKICTHAGCPTGLYQDTVHQILCPCHQSTFVASRGCEVIFGPASRPLPQLPLEVDDDGYLVSAGDFEEPPGPSFWELG